jgi:hypothetical protein
MSRRSSWKFDGFIEVFVVFGKKTPSQIREKQSRNPATKEKYFLEGFFWM